MFTWLTDWFNNVLISKWLGMGLTKALTIISAFLIDNNIGTVQQAQTWYDATVPLLPGLGTFALSVLLSKLKRTALLKTDINGLPPAKR